MIRTGRQTALRAYQAGVSIGRRRTLTLRTRSPRSRSYSTRTAYSKTHPAATRSVLFVAWCHTNTIIPDPYNPLDWNRYSYARYNPVKYTDPTGHIPACDKDDWACQTHWDDPVVEEEPTWTDEEISAMTPDGRKDSFVFAIGFPTSLHARNRDGMKIPTTFYWGLSIVYDNTGGIQLYSETLDISFKPRLELSPGEKANPSDLLGAGVSLTRGLIWKEGFNTEQYYGEATSWGGGIDIVTADYYESFPDRTLKGLDIGVSAGFPVSGWRISTFAERITPRIDLTFWSNDYCFFIWGLIKRRKLTICQVMGVRNEKTVDKTHRDPYSGDNNRLFCSMVYR